MPSKDKSFIYYQDDLIRGINNTAYYDYYNRLVDRYQNDRYATIRESGTFDDYQLGKERYLDKAEFISHIEPSNATDLLFANRKNGYLAFTNEIPTTSLDPLMDLGFLTVGSFFEYLSRVKETQYEGFFKIGGQLCCYANISEDNIEVITALGNIPLLFFTETFTYTESTDKSEGVIGTALLSSPYYTDITLHIYTNDSISYLEPHFMYARTSKSDPNPIGKIPGEPIYKTLFINEFDSTITKVKISGTEIDLSQINTIVVASDDRFRLNYLGIKYTGTGTFEIAFCLRHSTEIPDSVELTVQYYVDGQWGGERICTVYFSDNEISSLTTTITIDVIPLYLDVPTTYTLRAETRYFLEHYSTKTVTEMYYLDKHITVPIQYRKTEDNRYVYETESVVIPSEKGKTPTEYLFAITDTYDLVNGFAVPVWVYGYTTGEIEKVPDDFIIITPKLTSDLTYTENGQSSYTFEFTWTGTLTLKTVSLKRITDSLKYFNTEDFTLTLVSSESDKLTYKLTLENKIFEDPQSSSTLTLRVLFDYVVQRKDLTTLKWRGETLYYTMTINYIKDRYTITDVSISNDLLGDGYLYYKIKDNVLNQYTDKYSLDSRLIPKGSMSFNTIVEKNDDVMGWNIRTKTWDSFVNILAYRDITLQFIGPQTQSNVYTLSHTRPVHPLVATPNIINGYVNTTRRIMIDLKYNDKITSIYVNGTLVNNRSTIEMDNVKDGASYILPIYNATRTEIIAIGIDFTPISEKDIPVTLVFNGVNDYDYTKWPVTCEFTIPVKPQSDITHFEFILGDDFAFDKESTGKLKLNDEMLADGTVIATIKNPTNEVIVAKPNFNPVGDGDFDTVNIYLDGYLSNQKEYYLDFEVMEYYNASKDNSLPNQLYYSVRIPFKVP